MLSRKRNESDLQGLLDGIKELLSSYIQKKLELYKIKAYEKLAISGSFLGYTLIVVLLTFNILILSLFTLGLFIGEMVDSMAAGFAILILISIFILLLFVVFKKLFRSFLLNLIVKIITKIENNEE